MEKRIGRLYQQVKANQKDCRFEDLAKLLEACGYELRKTASSHKTFRRAGATPITVVTRKPVKTVYVTAVLKAVKAIFPEVENQ